MAAINRVTTSNTFLQWMSTTDAVIGTVNLLTDGNGSIFVANTNFEVTGYLNVANAIVGTSNIANGLYVTGLSTLENANVATMSGAANTKIYSSISAVQDSAVAFAIALG